MMIIISLFGMAFFLMAGSFNEKSFIYFCVYCCIPFISDLVFSE